MAIRPISAEAHFNQSEIKLQHAWNAYAALRSLEMGVPDLRDNPAWQIIIQEAFEQFHNAFEASL